MGCHGVRRDDGLGQLMREVTPQEFLKTLNHHLAVVNKVSMSEETFQEMSQRLKTIEESLVHLGEEHAENFRILSQLVESYNKSNIQKVNNNSDETPAQDNSEKSQALAKINEAKEIHSSLGAKILNLKNEKNRIKSSINNFRPQGEAKRRWTNSDSFFDSYKTKVNLYSIVKLELRDGIHSFILLGKDLDHRPYLSDAESINTGTPIGDSCLGKKLGEEFIYQAPNGLQMKGKVLECSAPSVNQIEEIISSLDRPQYLESSEKIDPFHLQETYGTNTSRHRKGG